MNKPHILFLMHYMEIGGAEQALLGLLNALDYNRVDVDLFVYWHHGELMKYIPKQANLLPEIGSYAALELPIKECVKKCHFGVAFGRVWAKVMLWYNRKRLKEKIDGIQYTAQATNMWLPKINPDVEYDAAISFLPPNRINATKVRAKKRISWIHSDYTKEHKDWKADLRDWEFADTIVSISDDVTKTFLTVYPSLADKIVLIENMMSPAMVRQRADEFNIQEELCIVGGGKSLIITSIGRYSYQKNFENVPFICKEIITMLTKLMSVGRFSTAKNFDNVPDICSKVIAEGIDVKWYLIGFGPDEELIRANIKKAGMEDHVIILGKKENPYPYIKACDIYVQPSRYEGKAVTVREAQMLYKPVVITNYPTATSQVVDSEDGVIVPMDNEGCAKGIVDFILDEEKRNHIIEYLKVHDYGNEAEVEKFYKII